MLHRPPPAQAQAQPAQAQAQAQEWPPPPLNPPPPERNVLDVGFGAGLVTEETPPVKAATLPTTPAEKAWAVLITEAAALDPGSWGSVMVVDFPPEGREGTPPATVLPVVRPMVGSARHHQPGMKTGPVPNVLRVRVS